MCGRCFGCEYRCDCVCGYVGVVLAVNVQAMESRNMSNVFALNRSQERCFMMFYYGFTPFYLYTLTFVVLHCLLVLFRVEFE